jgi:hypothetical protein
MRTHARNLGDSTVLAGAHAPYGEASHSAAEPSMPRYLVERTFAASVDPLVDAPASAAVVDANTREGVTWVHSYVAKDRRRTYCICDGPSPEAIRMAARANGLPVDRITEVRVLDPYALR